MRAESGAAWLHHVPFPATQRFAHRLRSARWVKIAMSHTPDIKKTADEAPMANRARAQHCTAIRQVTTLTPSTELHLAGPDLLHFLSCSTWSFSCAVRSDFQGLQSWESWEVASWVRCLQQMQ